MTWRTLLHQLHWRREKEEHAEETRELTHDAINALQRDILRLHRQGEANRQHIDQLLSKSNDQLASVAERVAVAVGMPERAKKHREKLTT